MKDLEHTITMQPKAATKVAIVEGKEVNRHDRQTNIGHRHKEYEKHIEYRGSQFNAQSQQRNTGDATCNQ
jgi:hypothetical protein